MICTAHQIFGDQIKGHAACVGEKYIQSSVDKREGKRPFASPRCRWEDNTKMYDNVMGWQRMDRINLLGCWQFLHYLKNCQLLTKDDSALCS